MTGTAMIERGHAMQALVPAIPPLAILPDADLLQLAQRAITLAAIERRAAKHFDDASRDYPDNEPLHDDAERDWEVADARLRAVVCQMIDASARAPAGVAAKVETLRAVAGGKIKDVDFAELLQEDLAKSILTDVAAMAA